MKTPRLHTERLLLRPLRREDLPAIYAYAARLAYSQFLPYPSPASPDELTEVFGEAIRHDPDSDAYLWAVCLADTDTLIGLVEFNRDSATEASLHYEVADPYWGQGYATEAVRRALDWGQAAFPDLQEILADTHAGNIGSRRVLEKCGLEKYGEQLVVWEKSNQKVLLCHYRLVCRGR